MKKHVLLDDLLAELIRLADKGVLERLDPGAFRYVPPPSQAKPEELKVAYVDMTRSGSAYLISEHSGSDVYVSAINLRGAMNGDLVQWRMYNRKRRRPEGMVIDVIERATTRYVGVIRYFRTGAVVFVQLRYGTMEIEIPTAFTRDAEDFDRVVVGLTQWKTRPGGSYKGKVKEVLGGESTIDVEMKSLLIEQGFPLEFGAQVRKEMKRVSDKTPKEELDSRRDFRKVTTFTIDPVDAKDFDDALSLETMEDGSYTIGIHIADVSYYVRPGSALDKEAAYRGNSVYLVDRVLPMLPEILSNGICSLRPREEKLCYSVIVHMDDKGTVKKHEIARTVIKSNHRFTYEQVQETLEKGKGKFHSELNVLNHIARKLRKKRIDRGSINFFSSEMRFELNDKGFPIAIRMKKSMEAHQLVEEYMLLANRLVASFIYAKSKTRKIALPYRIHDQPDPSKLAEFGQMAAEFGLKLNLSTPKNIRKSLNMMADRARKDPTVEMLMPYGIRTMAKAEYSIDNIGHFGLAFKHYAHFTSPIRRYADLMVHRIVEQQIKRSGFPDKDQVAKKCRHISNQERKAVEAERASQKYFQVLFLKDRVGELFDAQIVAITDHKVFIRLKDNGCEGYLDPVYFKSRKGRSKMNLGRKISVRLIAADLMDRELRFEPAKG